jgi:hypothetical protein
MAKATLQEIFGINATQNSTALTLTKADFNSVGLNDLSSDDSAESLLLAIILRAKDKLTETFRDTNNDELLAFVNGFDSLSERNNNQYLRKQIILEIDLLLANSTIDPDNF